MKQGARIIHSQYGQVPLPLILDVGYNNPEAYTRMLQIQATHDHHNHTEHEHHDHHHTEHDHHHHSDHLANDGFVSVAFTSDRPFSLKKFQDFLDSLPTDVFRGKEILWFQESQLKHIFQLSGKRCTLDTVPAGTKAPLNQLVFIGRNLNADQIQRGLNDCLATSAARLSVR